MNAWNMGNVMVPSIAEDLNVSQVYVYKILNELIELGIITKILKGRV